MFGKNVNIPAALTSNLPALKDERDCSSAVGLHISALNAVHQAYIAAESSAKIKLVLHKQTRPSGKVFTHDEKVFYKNK